MSKKICLLILSLFVIALASSCDLNKETTTICKTDWTVMVYLAGDKNGLQSALENDLKEIVSGTNNKMRIIALLDTVDGTKIYSVTKNNKKQIYGGDSFPEINQESTAYLNTGDANTLKKFITFCKETYPAQKYCLIVGSHGKGVYEDSRSGNAPLPMKSFCFANDGSSGLGSGKDWIYTSELTSVYDRDEHVDLFIVDVCNLAFIEIMYQYRVGNGSFNADYILTSLPRQRTEGLPYDTIFANVTPTMSAVEFGNLVLNKKQLYDSQTEQYTAPFQSMAMVDTSKLEYAKNKIDAVSKKLVGKYEIYAACVKQCNEYYLNDSTDNTMYDAYQLFDNLSKWEPTDSVPSDLSNDVKALCADAALSLADCVVNSFLQPSKSMSAEIKFDAGINGLCIFAPIYEYQWTYNKSYNAIDTQTELGLAGPGQYAWCIDNAVADNGSVENWFELLDYYFDTADNKNGYNY